MAAIQGDPWVVQPRERARYEEQFRSLQPINGIITGAQAKGFMLQSQLPPMVLGQIWSLADTDADGKMDINEFSIACKLINLKLRGFEVPATLPPSLVNSVKNTPPVIPPLPTQVLNMSATSTAASIIPPRPQPPKSGIADLNLISTQATTQPLLSNMISQPPLIPMSTSNSNIIPPLDVTTTLNSSLTQPTAPIQPIIPPPQTTSIISSVPQMTPLIGSSLPQTTLISGSLSQTAPLIGSSLPQTTLIGSSAPLVQPVSATPLTSTIHTSGIPPIVPPVKPADPSVLPTVKPLGPDPIAGTPTSKSLERIGSIESPAQIEWAVPHQTKLKFTQLFNTTDRARTGYLSGPQARNLMLQSKLPHTVLAQIWALADMDSDGRLSCDEFVLAMYLCEQATQGKLPPAALPPELIPPAFRRASITSGGSVPMAANSRHGSISSQGSQPPDSDPAASLPQTTFEDKRKENFEKGQAELERRRRALLEAQRAESEARERKEREEQERRERAKAEQERKRQMEIQQQLQEQLEKERLLEEERKRQQEQREAARREMERQRQLEWEKQRSQELQQQRQRAQENVLRLKARNQQLSIELNSLTEQVKDLSQKICNTRVGVSNVKTTIDGMRTTRDTYMQELSQLKTKLKEQNARLIALSQEKMKLETRNKVNLSQSDQEALEQTQIAFDNKEILIKQLKDKLLDMEEQIKGKLNDIENNNMHLSDLQKQLNNLVSECELIYNEYEEKKNKVLQMKNINNNAANDYTSNWQNDNAWDTAPTADWGNTTETTPTATTDSGSIKYRAIYEFVARNQDEISFQPGDIITVPAEQTGEPGWLAGEIRGQVGWFPESYVERITDGAMDGMMSGVKEEIISRPLEGIEEVPEMTENTVTTNHVIESVPEQNIPAVSAEVTEEPEYYVACYPYQSIEQGDLSFNAGDIITVLKKEGEWWTGKIGDNIGIFPSNYVQKADTIPNDVTIKPAEVAKPIEPVDNGQAKQDVDAEISAINEQKRKSVDKSPDFASMSANTQTLKGTKKPEIATVLAPYQATSPEQLTLARGQLIMIRKKSESGWWEGELQAKGKKRQVGWFPATYVKVLESSGRNSGRNTPVSASRTEMQEMVLDKVIALFPYTAQNADELSFQKDDIISVTAREEPDWWRGELNGVSGLFPSNYVGPLHSSSAADKKRLEYIYELINSEKQYIEDLALVIEVFKNPLEQSHCVNSNTISKIFLNWEEILYCNQQFFQELTSYSNNNYNMIGDVICAHVKRMTPYIRFCSKQLFAASLLQYTLETSTAFRNEVKMCQSNMKTKGMPLSSFLIKPMQRITKYPLIINKILQYTPETHYDYYNLKTSLMLMENFCQEVNESVRRSESKIRLKWLQRHVLQNESNHIVFNSETNCLGPRQFLHYGTLIKVKSGKELLAFLLNDFLLLTTPNKPLCNERLTFYRDCDIELKIYKQPFLIKDIQLLNETKLSMENLHHVTDRRRLISLKVPNKTLLLYALTANDCSLWIKMITEAINNYVQISKPLHSLPGTPESAYQGRLLVGIKSGMHFQRPTGKLVCENAFCKVVMGHQEYRTSNANATLKNLTNTKQVNSSPLTNTVFEWNATMQFHIHDLRADVIQFFVYEECNFTPNYFLGKLELKVWDIYKETKDSIGPLKKKLMLQDTEAGAIEIKLDLHLFDNFPNY